MNDFTFAGILTNYIPAIRDMFDDDRFMRSGHWYKIDQTRGINYCCDQILNIYQKHYLTKTRKAKLIRKYVTG